MNIIDLVANFMFLTLDQDDKDLIEHIFFLENNTDLDFLKETE